MSEALAPYPHPYRCKSQVRVASLSTPEFPPGYPTPWRCWREGGPGGSDTPYPPSLVGGEQCNGYLGCNAIGLRRKGVIKSVG